MTAMQQLLDFADAVRGDIARLERSVERRSAVLDVLVRRSDRRSDTQRFRVRAEGVLEFSLSFPREIDSIRLVQRHPLLWSHQQDELELYFTGAIADPHGTIGRLYVRHEALAYGWIPFGAFINNAVPLPELLSSEHGLLARGPQTPIMAYQDVLEKSGARCSVLKQEGRPELSDEDGPKLLILGKSYIIATTFDAEQVHVVDPSPAAGTP